MRLHYLMFLVAILPACDQGPNDGKEGFKCRSGLFISSFCDDGLRCIDSICIACGAPGETCCTEGTSLGCDSNVACVGADWEDPGTCMGECGSIGLQCCNDGCPGGGTPTGVPCMCAGDAGDPCQGGKFEHTVWVIGPDCVGAPITFKTDTPEQAEQCRQDKLVALAGPDAQICKLDEVPTDEPVCKNGEEPLYLTNCGKDHLATCEAFLAGPEATWADGACP